MNLAHPAAIAPAQSGPQRTASAPGINHNDLSSVRNYRLLAAFVFLLAFMVVGLGAYTRLVHAGLGCPDWPGCYGHLTWPTSSAEISAAEARFPESPVELDKTWPEMVHRYFAGGLGLLIMTLAAMSLVVNKQNQQKILPVKLPALILLVVIIQAAFGMWTVTLKLWPQVVTAHLLGGFTTLALIGLLNFRINKPVFISNDYFHRKRLKIPFQGVCLAKKIAIAGFISVAIQISLGGWTAANYAALPCIDFPTCQGSFWPEMDFSSGFNISQNIGPNYLGGQLDGPARTAIHMSHRLGAVCVFILITVLLAVLIKTKLAQRQLLGNQTLLLSLALFSQLALGIANVIFVTPLFVAVLHNLFGAILLLTVIYCWFSLSSLEQQLEKTFKNNNK